MNGVRSLNGSWTYNPISVGDYAGFSTATSGGVWDFRWDPADNSVRFNISGHLDPVPEPASLCALSLGALGILRRRKA